MKTTAVKGIILFHLVLLFVVALGTCVVADPAFPSSLKALRIPFGCGLAGCVGGMVYCLRGIYRHVCFEKDWDDAWSLWYCIRPGISFILGVVSYVFLKAGLFTLDTSLKSDAHFLGFFAFAFMAGFSVDDFVVKLGKITHVVWGVEEKSKASPKPGEKTKK